MPAVESHQIQQLITEQFGEGYVIEVATAASPICLVIETDKLLEVAQFLHTHPSTYFDSLSCITGVDVPENQVLEVIYHLYSIPYNLHLALKVIVPRNQEGEALPEVPSLTPIWKGADWHERETYDLLGINFVGHPDLRRILLPADWEGYPLRKDYEAQTYYHGIKVAY